MSDDALTSPETFHITQLHSVLDTTLRSTSLPGCCPSISSAKIHLQPMRNSGELLLEELDEWLSLRIRWGSLDRRLYSVSYMVNWFMWLKYPRNTRQAATTWSDADCQKAIERTRCEIHQVTPAKCKIFDKVFQHHERQLLQDVGTRATGSRSKFA